MHAARQFLASQHTHQDHGEPLLRRWRGGWWQWETSRWREVEPAAVERSAYLFTEAAHYLDDRGDLKPWNPTRRKIHDLLHALGAACHLADRTDQPSWIAGEHQTENVIVSCSNGLLDVIDRTLIPHTPLYFNTTAVPFAYTPDAPVPPNWLAFLDDLWGDDHDQIRALQEWFGYIVSGRLDLHKIMLIVGPTRAGKGVIARALGALIGQDNVAGPTLSSLSGDFGLAPLLGKSLAVVSDARLGGRDSNVVVERLLSISGEDTLTVNRKYREQWTGKLPARLLICSNELPRLGDASAAIAGRFVTLMLTHSFYGREDKTLERRLRTELPGILNWALDGLARLVDQDAFTRPTSTTEAYVALQDLASPISAFLRERCVVGPDQQIPCDELYAAWGEWTEANGHRKTATSTFGRDLRAAVPAVRRYQPGSGNNRRHHYDGLNLNTESVR